MKCPKCGNDNPADDQFCGGCGKQLQRKQSSGVNVSALIAHSAWLIFVFGGVGTAIGIIVASSMFSEMVGSGIIGLFIIMMVIGMGMVGGIAIGAVVAIVIGLISQPHTTKWDYLKIIGTPLIIPLIIVGAVVFPAALEEYGHNKAGRENRALVTLLQEYLPSVCPYYRTTVGTYYEGKGYFDGVNWNADDEGGGRPC
jgi:MFS family permease